MQIIEYPSREKLNIPKCVMALGFFDGVHIAHRDLLRIAAETAAEMGFAFGVFTFGSGGKIKADTGRLYSDDEKAEMFSELGADFTIIADFDAISGYTPEAFVNDILRRDLNCHICVAGFNFRFGRGASADSTMLTRLMRQSGGDTRICDEITLDGLTISATLIRRLITEGRIEEANLYLGAPYYIKGRVLHGRKDGRTIGFPTVNISIDEGRVVPKYGVYRTAVVIDGKIYSGVSNVGICPTFGGNETRLETHIIDFSGDMYGKELRIYLLGFLREEKRFESINELKMQINIDKNTTIRENGDIKWQELGLK